MVRLWVLWSYRPRSIASPAGGERAWDEKSVARRAHGLMVATGVFACLRIFAAQALHRPLAYQGGIIIFKHRKLGTIQATKHHQPWTA
jgi:hypothetical protein